jgi:hypothetical protein
MTNQEAEAIIQDIEAKLDILSQFTQTDILNISFKTINGIESVGTELYSLSSRMRKVRAAALEKQYLAEKS